MCYGSWDQTKFKEKSEIYFFSVFSMFQSQIQWDKILSSELLASKWPWFNISVPWFWPAISCVWGEGESASIFKTLKTCSNIMMLDTNIYQYVLHHLNLNLGCHMSSLYWSHQYVTSESWEIEKYLHFVLKPLFLY